MGSCREDRQQTGNQTRDKKPRLDPKLVMFHFLFDCFPITAVFVNKHKSVGKSLRYIIVPIQHEAQSTSQPSEIKIIIKVAAIGTEAGT